MGVEVLLERSVDDIGRTTTLDFRDQPKRRVIVLVYPKCLGDCSRHALHRNRVTS